MADAKVLPMPNAGTWGERWKKTLKRVDPKTYAAMKKERSLNEHAESVEDGASREYAGVLNGLLEQEGLDRLQDSGSRLQLVARCQALAESVVWREWCPRDPRQEEWDRNGYTDENTADWDDSPMLPKPSPSPYESLNIVEGRWKDGDPPIPE